MGTPVACGIDVLRADSFALLKAKRVGLITNHTGVAADGVATIDLLHQSEGVELVRLFCPEHGLRGTAENGIKVEDGKDPKTGLPVVSLYGESRKPTAEHLAGLDVLVFDIQDIGARFYTYIATMGLAMEAAAEAGIGFVVLDRPNPIGGHRVEGPLPGGELSFVCPHDLPIRHGMTVGELAQMFRAERGLDQLDLKVVKMDGYRREMWFDDTGVPWHAPSPNIPDLDSAIVYPGIGMLEFLNVSVGRGTEAPFRTVGAPFINGAALAAELVAAELKGVEFLAIDFVPSKSKFVGEQCSGVRIRVTNRDRCQPLEIASAIAGHLAREHREAVLFDEKIGVLLNHPKTAEQLQDRTVALNDLWEADEESFLRRRKAFLFYR